MVHAVIMAGGSGTRFWPRSRSSKPKQFLNLFGNKTMLRATVDRLSGFISPENVMVVTNESYVDLVQEQLPQSNRDDIIGEPVAKNTAPCVAAAAARLYRKDPESVMVLLPADHLIENPEAFKKVLNSAVETARTENSLVTIGIKPTHPETGYGYIRFDKEGAFKKGENRVYSVKNFTEKPDEKTARNFLEAGDYLWNSGMFVWKTSVIIDAFKSYLPEIYQNIEHLLKSKGSKKDIDTFYHACPSVSIDYGIMEKAETVHVVPGEFGWNDVGSWKAVYDLSEKDSDGNVIDDTPVSIQKSKSNLVHSESGKLISLIGMENVAVVETDNAILVLNLDESQRVKDVVEELKNNPQKSKYL